MRDRGITNSETWFLSTWEINLQIYKSLSGFYETKIEFCTYVMKSSSLQNVAALQQLQDALFENRVENRTAGLVSILL